MNRKVLVATVVLATLILSLVITPLLIAGPSSRLGLNLRDEVRNHMTVTLEVYKNGELVRRKVGDPISDQWLKLVTLFLLGYDYYGDLTWYYEDGTQPGAPLYYYFGTEYSENNPIPKLAIGTGTAAYPSDYALVSKVMEASLDSNYITVTDTGSTFNVTYSYTFVSSGSYDISEAGLFIQVNGKEISNKWVLVAHDTFTPVSLQVDDAITITYKFTIDYSSPPFLKTFWELLLDYFMGLRGAGCPVGSTRIDLGRYWFDAGVNRAYYITSKISFAYVLTDIPWSPTISTSYDATSIWNLREFDIIRCSNQEINTTLTIIQGDSQNTYTAYGIMIYLYADTNPSSGSPSLTYLPIAYIRFNQPPLTIDHTKYFVVDLVIQFNQG